MVRMRGKDHITRMNTRKHADLILQYHDGLLQGVVKSYYE